MSLSCSCDYDPEPGMIIWYSPNDYSLLTTTKRKRCCSCNELIDKGSISTSFERYKIPDSEIEESIYGEGGEIPMASKYMCERCSDLYFSINELGFCINLDDDMRDLVKEYKRDYVG